ncbi:hypothetical protein [Lyngbya aestuarii]|uniref:hypothetical protein n=1 Tax=Lyngbya aestuarii TaxID=118322 RepID=UPI00403DFF84
MNRSDTRTAFTNSHTYFDVWVVYDSYNLGTDEYGGSVETLARLLLEKVLEIAVSALSDLPSKL